MKILLTSLLIFISFSSNAFTGNELYGHLKEGKKIDQESYYSGLYQGYVLGVTDGLIEIRLICYSDGVTNKQIFDIVGKYLKNNLEVRNVPASNLIYRSLKGLYPCKKE